MRAPDIIELTEDSWSMALKKLRGGPKKWPGIPPSQRENEWLLRRNREALLKNRTYATLARLPNGKLVRALALRDLLKVIDHIRLEYAEDRLILYHGSGKAELYYQEASL